MQDFSELEFPINESQRFYLQPDYRLELTARLVFAERPQRNLGVGQTGGIQVETYQFLNLF
jgi:hypothetical protein